MAGVAKLAVTPWLASLAFLPGCRALAALGILVSPEQVQNAELDLTDQRLAVVVDSVRPGQANPVFEMNLCKRIAELLRENKVPSQVVPYEEVVRLRANPEFPQWSIPRIGRALKAQQVLYLRIEDLRLRTAPGDAILTPSVALTVRVIGVGQTGEQGRLWPDPDAEPDGRRVTHSRAVQEAESPTLIDSETAKLAREAAYYVARHFYKYDLETLPPREP